MFLWRLENESIKRLGLIEAKRKKKRFLNGLFVKLFRKNVSFKESHEHHDQLGPRE
jgi:16S rRNA G527 N7-methylase RsmG